AVLSKTDTVVYVLVGIFFFLAALLSLCYGIGKFGYSLWNLAQSGISAVKPGSKAPTALIDFVSDLLLTLIIMEVLGTVVQYLRYRETSLKPFLFIGIISATRGILAVGARLSITEGGALKIDDFRTDMVELGVNAAVIIALGVTMRLIGPYLQDRTLARHPHTHSRRGDAAPRT
ncbi:MAG TPA: phosphate-starvation-inducible PsiE family protein, partial [Ktedonobacterales bacterium]|nr:phosphate-starvation-inducible PsiE family protein [Ktedonobacterales bacterium]